MNKAFIAFAIIGLALLLVTFRPLEVSVHNSEATATQPTAEAHQDHLGHSHDVSNDLSKDASHDHQDTDPESAEAGSGKTGNPHFDQLSPSVKKALKNSLLLENDTKTFTNPDGGVVLPTQGRSTQVTVAVQMPDGSIQIREYSNLPKNAGPKIELKKEIKN